jgi:hypothetical protein
MPFSVSQTARAPRDPADLFEGKHQKVLLKR